MTLVRKMTVGRPRMTTFRRSKGRTKQETKRRTGQSKRCHGERYLHVQVRKHASMLDALKVSVSNKQDVGQYDQRSNGSDKGYLTHNVLVHSTVDEISNAPNESIGRTVSYPVIMRKDSSTIRSGLFCVGSAFLRRCDGRSGNLGLGVQSRRQRRANLRSKCVGPTKGQDEKDNGETRHGILVIPCVVVVLTRRRSANAIVSLKISLFSKLQLRRTIRYS